MNVGSVASSSIDQFVSNQRPPTEAGIAALKKAEDLQKQTGEALVRSATPAPTDTPTAVDPPGRYAPTANITSMAISEVNPVSASRPPAGITLAMTITAARATSPNPMTQPPAGMASST